MLHAMSSIPSPAPPGPPWRSHTCFRFGAVPRIRFTKNSAFLPSGSLQSRGTSTCAHSASFPPAPVNAEHGAHETASGFDVGGGGCGGAGGGEVEAGIGTGPAEEPPHAAKEAVKRSDATAT